MNKTWWWWQAMALHPIPLPCALAFPPPSHRDATMPSPCWAPHFITQERIMFSNPTPSKPRLSPAATMSRWAMPRPRHRLSLRPCTAPYCCSLQHLLKLSLLSLRPSLLQFVSIVSSHSPSLHLGLPAPQPSRCHHAQSLLGPSIHDPRMYHVLRRIPPRANRVSLPPRRWAMTRHRLSLHLCTAPLSCSLQPLLKLSLLSLRPFLLPFVSIVSPLLNHRNPIFQSVCLFYCFLFCLCFSYRNELQL